MSQEQNGFTVTIPGTLTDFKLSIPGKMPGLNEYVEANRTNHHKGAQMKRDCQEAVQWCIKSQIRQRRIKKPVFLLFTFYEKDRRRDHDNVSSFARKVIQDALVASGVLQDDGWNHVTGYLDLFRVDPQHPRIVVQFIEQEEIKSAKKNKTGVSRGKSGGAASAGRVSGGSRK